LAIGSPEMRRRVVGFMIKCSTAEILLQFVVVVVVGIVRLRIFDYDNDNDNDRKPSPNICTAALGRRTASTLALTGAWSAALGVGRAPARTLRPCTTGSLVREIARARYLPLMYCSSEKEKTHSGRNATRITMIQPLSMASGRNISGKNGSTVWLNWAKL